MRQMNANNPKGMTRQGGANSTIGREYANLRASNSIQFHLPPLNLSNLLQTSHFVHYGLAYILTRGSRLASYHLGRRLGRSLNLEVY